MTARLSVLLSADADQAKKELAAVRKALKDVGGEAQVSGTQATTAAKGTDQLATAAGRASGQLRALDAAQDLAANSSRQLAATNGLAAGQVGNLTAQFNDIGIMLAAGQNPLQLAIQQGTQITQVIGPMGATGAVAALKSAFMGMLNPVSLLTIGIIAGGAALAQWAIGAGQASDEADELAAKLAQVADNADAARQSLRADVLAISEDELILLDAIAAKQEEIVARRQEIRGGGAAAAIDFEARNALTAAEAELQALRDQLTEIRQIAEERERMLDRTRELSDAERQVGESLQAAVARRREAEARGQALLATLQSQAEVQRLIALHGEDSRQVAEARAAAEREAFIQHELSAYMSEELQEALKKSWDNANGIAGTDMAAGINTATASAAQLAETLGIAYSTAIAIKNVGGGGATGPDDARSQLYDQGRIGGALTGVLSVTRTGPDAGIGRVGARGGGGGRAQVNAADQLIQRLQQELDLARELDPVQKQMIRNRETLATATEGQRAKIEELIAQKERETALMEREQQIWDGIRSAGENALDTLIRRGGDLEDVLATLAVDLLEVILLGGDLGGGGGGKKSGGGFWSWLGFDKGGYTGDGGHLEPAGIVHRGEFVVNANEVRKPGVRELLETINDGMPGYAMGGLVGGGGAPARAASAPAGRPPLHIEQHFHGAAGNEEVARIAREATQDGIRGYDAEVLPRRMSELRSNPRRIG